MRENSGKPALLLVNVGVAPSKRRCPAPSDYLKSRAAYSYSSALLLCPIPHTRNFIQFEGNPDSYTTTTQRKERSVKTLTSNSPLSGLIISSSRSSPLHLFYCTNSTDTANPVIIQALQVPQTLVVAPLTPLTDSTDSTDLVIVAIYDIENGLPRLDLLT